MTIYLYVKTHRKTGLKYLGKTEQDPFKYKGSGKYWKLHLKKHGSDLDTEILQECQTKDEVHEWGIYYSNLWNIVKSDQWANMKPEEGEGGSTSDIQSRPEIQVKKKATWAKNGTKFRWPIMRGEDNPVYNHTLYDFYNTVTHERVITTQYDLHKRFGVSRAQICGVVRGNALSAQNWRLYENKDKIKGNANRDRKINRLINSTPVERIDRRCGKNNKRYDHTLYEFYNTKTHEIVVATQHEFKNKFLPNNNNIPGLVSGKHKIIAGWIIVPKSD